MDCGFETVGNATLIVYDKEPILATDPWLKGSNYFGSWVLSHIIGDEQLENINKCKYLWLSHGHPDHIQMESLSALKNKIVLVPDHVGSRIKNDLLAEGFNVQVIEDRKWVRLSERVQVICIVDYNQDAVLLVEINGRLVVNLNDSKAFGHQSFIKKIIRQFSKSFLIMLTGHGDADMINFFDEDKKRIAPVQKDLYPLGKAIAEKVDGLGAKYFIPFSSMHRYQREDSLWANEYVTQLDEYEKGYESKNSKILPAFIQYDCTLDTWKALNPQSTPTTIVSPKDFGDDWSENLEKSELELARKYFQSIEHFYDHFDFITLKVGGQSHHIELRSKNFKKGITFEAPRQSLVSTIQYKVFDDLLVGNFMKATLHGNWPQSKFYPDFTPYISKYADNGGARTKEELKVYFREYRKRAGLDYFVHRFEETTKNIVRKSVPQNSLAFQNLKRIYWQVKGLKKI
jgi:hypothetical protein